MKLIAHRGNINGPNKNQENNPEYILNAIKQGYYVELDLWLVDNKLYLGHDFPKYEINRNFLTDIKEKLFCHCKNISALHYILKNNPEIECFYHTNDDCVLTSKGNIWNHYKTLEFTSKSICVMPELCNYNIVDNNIIGVCSDYVKSYK
tara:strand:- start:699 stop:1145 length:447 start_codon:yes stop_codon:yes gene_type:complete